MSQFDFKNFYPGCHESTFERGLEELGLKFCVVGPSEGQSKYPVYNYVIQEVETHKFVTLGQRPEVIDWINLNLVEGGEQNV